MKRIFLLFMLMFNFVILFSQIDSIDINNYQFDNTKKIESFSNVSFVNQYVWRGTLIDAKPNIQPVLGVAFGGFEVGMFGSVSLFNDYYEADLFAAYTVGAFTLTATDFYMDVTGMGQNYFDYSDTAAGHHVTCDLAFNGTKNTPFAIIASTIIYSGLDLDSGGKNKYTTYFEVKYLMDEWEFFVGGLTGQSDFYLNDKDGFNFANVGFVYNYEIKISDEFSIPTIAQIAVNPQMEKLFFTFNVTF